MKNAFCHTKFVNKNVALGPRLKYASDNFTTAETSTAVVFVFARTVYTGDNI